MLVIVVPTWNASGLGEDDEPVRSGEAPLLEHAATLAPFETLPSDPVLTHVANVPHGTAKGLWLHDGFAYASSRFHLSVIDVRDPEAPQLVKKLPIPSRDVDILEVNGRTILGVDDDRAEILFVDATDPVNAYHVSTISLPGNSHNLVALPGTTLFYNSRAYNPPGIDIIDVADPENPVLVKVWNDGYPCHDITVYTDVGRAYCANAWGQTYVLDITDPLNPVRLLRITNPDIYIHHWAIPTPDHRTLIIGDEKYGEPDGCVDSTTTPVGTISASSGAVWFYDIAATADLGLGMSAIEKGWVSLPAEPTGPCTSHFGSMIGDTGVMVVGWYTGGVVLIDYDGPGMPRLVDQYRVSDSYAWDARYVDGYVFVGDSFRGLDVLRVDFPLGPPPGE